MDLLQETRIKIDEIDAQMAALFEQRMEAVTKVAQYKAETGKPVFDSEREAQVIEKNTGRIHHEELKPYYRAFQNHAMSVSRAYQREILGRDMAAYQGVPGAWSHIALKKMFPFSRAKAYTTWNEVCDAVVSGDAYFGVLPFENSNAGDVSAVMDLIYAYPNLVVTHMLDMPIRQDLLGLPGSKLEEIRTVISHQQAIAQSEPFLRAHGMQTKIWGNTADAARYVAELNDPTAAAIASSETAELYGLEILAKGINEDKDNTTRFIVVERSDRVVVGKPVPGQRVSILFTADHKPGMLARVIELIGHLGLNMECIKSRPLPHVQFEYYFYIQVVWPNSDLDIETLWREMDAICRTCRPLGVFELDSAEI